MKPRALFSCLIAALSLSSFGLEAAAGDPRQAFDSDCAACHGQGAAQFLQNSVKETHGVLVTRKTGVALETFLRDHFRHRNDEQIAVILNFFRQD